MSFKYTYRHHAWYAAQVSHGTTYVVLTLSLLLRPVWPSTYEELVSLSKKKYVICGGCCRRYRALQVAVHPFLASSKGVVRDASFKFGQQLPFGPVRAVHLPAWDGGGVVQGAVESSSNGTQCATWRRTTAICGLGSPFKGLGSPFKGPGSPFKGQPCVTN